MDHIRVSGCKREEDFQVGTKAGTESQGRKVKKLFGEPLVGQFG